MIFDIEDDFIATSETSKSKTVAFTSAGSNTAPITFATKVNDSANTSDSSISATLTPGAGYNITTTQADQTASIVILDSENEFDMTKPRVSIWLVGENTINEGDSFAVTISTGTVIPTAGNPIDLNINVDQENGNYIAFRVPRFVTLTKAESEKTINIRTLDDSIVDGEGKIIVSISGVENGYSIGRVIG